MGCSYQPDCGGCCFRDKTEEEYRKIKEEKVLQILNTVLKQRDYVWEKPIFLADGARRRAAFAFGRQNNKFVLGFNENRSGRIVDCQQCFAVTENINAVLADLRLFLERFCIVGKEDVKIKKKKKQKKQTSKLATGGDVLLLDADNGLDVVLEYDADLSLEQKMEIFEFVNAKEKIVRFSYRRKNSDEAEPIIEKIKPIIKIWSCDVYVAPGTFLQASKAGESALVEPVVKYLGDTCGKIADLFCGIGTFSYPLAGISGNKITAVDVSESLLKGFQLSVNRQMMHNIEIKQRNLFKYPLAGAELEGFDAVVFDPPRAGAATQVKELTLLAPDKRPKKIIAVSCNPHSFVNDANVLITGGYMLKSVTLVDQFVYSNHSELVALFTK